MTWLKNSLFELLKGSILSLCLYIVVTLILKQTVYCGRADIECKINSLVDGRIPIFFLAIPITILLIYLWNTFLDKLNDLTKK